MTISSSFHIAALWSFLTSHNQLFGHLCTCTTYMTKSSIVLQLCVMYYWRHIFYTVLRGIFWTSGSFPGTDVFDRTWHTWKFKVASLFRCYSRTTRLPAGVEWGPESPLYPVYSTRPKTRAPVRPLTPTAQFCNVARGIIPTIAQSTTAGTSTNLTSVFSSNFVTTFVSLP